MKKQMAVWLVTLAIASASAEVRVYVEQDHGKACIKYDCTAGETVRAFALDVSVDAGRILDIADFFRGPSTAPAQGYGIFPASFRDHLMGVPDANIDWNVSGYTPLADRADYPSGTLPGLNSSGVTLEFGGLWDGNVPAAVPPSMGTLCSLRLSERATVSVGPNASRGGVLATEPDTILGTAFESATVQPPEITGLSVTNGVLTISFAGGELETASAPAGPWAGTGNTSGQYTETAGEVRKFFRVRGL